MRSPQALVAVLVGLALGAPAPLIAQPAATVSAATKAPAGGGAKGRRPHRKGAKAARRPVVVDAPAKPAGAAGPPGSFEALYGAAEPLGDLARALEPFTEVCNEQLDMTRRQCLVVRSYLQSVLRRRLFRSEVEPGALVVGPYVQKQGARTLTLRGCLACQRAVRGDRPHLVSVRPPARLGAGEVKGQEIASLKIPHPSSHVGELWMRDVGSKLKAELVFKLGPRWTRKIAKTRVRRGREAQRSPWDDGSGEARGLTLNLLGYRVYDRCTGEVLLSRPQAAFKVPVARNQPDCPKPAPKTAATQPGVRQPDPSWPYVLSVGEIRRAMDAVRGQVQACYLQFQIPGTAEIEIDIGGMDGNVLGVKVSGKFEDTPTGDCVSAAVSAARFPNFRATSMKVPYNFFLR